MRLAILMGAIVLAGCAETAEQQASKQAEAQNELARAIGDRVPGKPQDCVSASFTDGPQIIDQNTVLYRQGGRVWRNELAAACPALTPFGTMVVEIHGSQLCRNDQFRVIEAGSHIPSAYCRFGKFTPYDRKR